MLQLDPVVPADTDALFEILSDPAGWWFDPAGRHREVGTTRRWVERAAGRWGSDGLSYWTVRLPGTGEVVGVGGAQRHRSGVWNLYYRIAVAHQRNGYALELGRAGIDAAHAADPARPVVAWVAERNHPSRRVAERLGLRLHGLHVDASDGAVRLAYADRPLRDAPPG